MQEKKTIQQQQGTLLGSCSKEEIESIFDDFCRNGLLKVVKKQYEICKEKQQTRLFLGVFIGAYQYGQSEFNKMYSIAFPTDGKDAPLSEFGVLCKQVNKLLNAERWNDFSPVLGYCAENGISTSGIMRYIRKNGNQTEMSGLRKVVRGYFSSYFKVLENKNSSDSKTPTVDHCR